MLLAELAERIAAFPERPPSEVEWEELLTRMEIAPRAFALAAGDARGADGIVPVLTSALVLEVWLGAALRNLQAGESVPLDFGFTPGTATAAELLQEFSSTRARNFAALQRRGIVVWDWAAPETDGTRLTTYRAVCAVVTMDGRHLAALRADRGRG